MLQRNKKFANKKRKRDYLLTGLLFRECGSRRVGDGANKAGHFYYRCADRIRKFPLRSDCDIPGVNARILDAMLWQQLKERLEDSTLLHKAVEEFLQIENDNVEDAEILRLQSLMQRLDEEEKRYAQAYGIGALQLQNYQDLMKDVNKRRESLQAQMSILKTEKIEKAIAISPEELYNEAQSVIKEIDFTDKQGVIRDVVDKVTIKERSGVDVWVHVPLSTQKLGNEPECWNCGITKCREKHTFQCAFEKAAGFGCKLSFCNH